MTGLRTVGREGVQNGTLDVQDILDGLPDAVALLDDGGRAMAVNLAFTRAFQVIAPRLASAADFRSVADESGIVPWPDGGGAAARLTADGRAWRVGERALAGGGRLLWWREVSVAEAGAAAAHALLAQLDTVLATVGQGVMILDGGLRVVRMNEPCGSMLGLPQELTLAGTPAHDILRFCARRGDFGPGDPEEQVAELLTLYSLDEPQSYERTGPDGIAIRARSHPVAGGGVVMTYADETEYRHAVDDLYAASMTIERSVAEHVDDLARVSAALEQATARAEDAAQVKARTLALVSREMRVPVATVVDGARRLLSAALGREEHEAVSRILQAVEALRLILDDLGDLARLEADEITLEAAPFRLETVIGSVLGGMSGRAEAAGLRLTGAVDPALPDTVRGDAAWLRHVLVELLGLALRDGRSGTIAITAEPAVLPDRGAGIRLAVEGVSAETAAELRAWLVNGMPPPATGEGLRAGLRGLGLHICRRIVGLMGGEMGAGQPQAGRGASLWFTAGLAEAPSPPSPSAPERHNILVVEDNPVNQRVNAWLLEREGHRVTVVGDGRHAVEMVARGGFDAVLMDLDLPGLDGIEATRAIRSLDGAVGRVPVIAITNSALTTDVERCRAAGMDDHMPKPVNPAGLMRVLGRLTRGDARAPGAELGILDESVLAALEGVIGRNPVAGLVADVLDQAAGLGPRLLAAPASLDLAAVESAAGEVKAIAGTVGMTRVYDLAARLERLSRDGRRDEALDGAVELARLLDLGCARLRASWGLA